MNVEGQVFESIDLVKVAGFSAAFTIVVAKVVDDGFADIEMINLTNKAKLSGIEIKLKEVHAAHAVSGGPVRYPKHRPLCKEACLNDSAIEFGSILWLTKITTGKE